MNADAVLERVSAVIAGIAPGDVWTYGEVAEAAGRPGAARAVGAAAGHAADDLPWWRVVAANGRLVPGHERVHADAAGRGRRGRRHRPSPPRLSR